MPVALTCGSTFWPKARPPAPAGGMPDALAIVVAIAAGGGQFERNLALKEEKDGGVERADPGRRGATNDGHKGTVNSVTRW